MIMDLSDNFIRIERPGLFQSYIFGKSTNTSIINLATNPAHLKVSGYWFNLGKISHFVRDDKSVP
jgi:hypothetical protein